MQLFNGILAFGGLLLGCTQPLTTFMLAAFWLYLQWPSSNWHQSSDARGFSKILNLVATLVLVAFVMSLQMYNPAAIAVSRWLFLFLALFAAQALLSIILAIPRMPLVVPLQTKLMQGLKQLRPAVNLIYGIALLCFLAINDYRIFAPQILLLWLLFNASTLRYAPDPAIAAIFRKTADVVAISLVLALVLFVPMLSTRSEQSSLVFMTIIVYGPIWTCAGVTLATVINNAVALCGAKNEKATIKKAAEH